jgi:hypothetical protein
VGSVFSKNMHGEERNVVGVLPQKTGTSNVSENISSK